MHATQRPKILRILSRPIRFARLKVTERLGHRMPLLSRYRRSELFFGAPFTLKLPASADIYLYGCRVRPAEFAVTAYLLGLESQDLSYVDVGANYGFYALLMADVMNAKVYAIEPAKEAYDLLKINCADHLQISTYNTLVGDKEEERSFYTFPTKYAEYNTTELTDFHLDSQWIDRNQPVKTTSRSTTLDRLLLDQLSRDAIIKIDAEEDSLVIVKGAANIIQKYRPTFILRYWPHTRNSHQQVMAIRYLVDLDYEMYFLDTNGQTHNMKSDISTLDTYDKECVLLIPHN